MIDKMGLKNKMALNFQKINFDKIYNLNAMKHYKNVLMILRPNHNSIIKSNNRY